MFVRQVVLEELKRIFAVLPLTRKFPHLEKFDPRIYKRENLGENN